MNIADRIYKEMLHEQASLWYISDNFGSKVMIKTQSISIKSLLKGCRIEFLFGKDTMHQPAIFHTGVRIYDDPIHYLTITGVERYYDELNSLEKIMNRSNTYIHFHNELNVCVAYAIVTFEINDQIKALNLLSNIENLFTGDFNRDAVKSLDCFEYSLKIDREFQDIHEIETLIIEGKLSEWKIMENNFIGFNETNKILIDDNKEGDNFEKQVWVSLESLFENQLYRNPKTHHKKVIRELTDVFAFSDYGIFLIETKALSILNTDIERTMERKVIGLKKQIVKAINQLMGATKKIKANEDIYSNVV